MIQRRSFLAIWACFVLARSVPIEAADSWPQMRGPTGQGLSTARDVPIHWSTTDNVAWKITVPGKGWSTPALENGRIYVTTAVPVPPPDGSSRKPDQSLRAICLDMASGETIWDEEVFLQDGETSPDVHAKNGFASPSPIVDNGQLFVHFGHEGIACLALNGHAIWKTHELRYEPRHGNGGSPALFEDHLLVICDGADQQFTANLDRHTGDVKWKTARETDGELKFSFCTPLVIDVNGRKQVISAGAHHAGGYDLETGESLWYVTYSGWSLVPRPVYGHGMVFFSTGYVTPQLFAVRPDGLGDVTDSHLAWSDNRSVCTNPSPLIVGDELYIMSDDGVLTCYDARTGDVHYRERIGGDHVASPLYVDGRIYLLSERGQGTVVKCGLDFKSLATNDLGERTFASYVPFDGGLLIRSEDHLYRMGQ